MKLRLFIAAAVLACFALTTSGATAKPDKPQRHRVDLTGETKMDPDSSIIPGPTKDQGTITGRPFGDGKIKLKVQLDIPSQTATGTFRVRTDKGTALGTVDMNFEIVGGEVDFTGTADFTGGKGLYKGIQGTDLKAHDHNTLDGQNGEISLKGFATY